MIHDSYFLPQIASFFEQESLKREISFAPSAAIWRMSRPAVFTEFHCVVGFSSPRGGVCEKAKDMETDDEDVEEPSFGPPHHGEHCDIVPKPKEPPALVFNDLEMAMETDYDDVQEPGAVPKRKKVPKKKKRPHGAVPKRKRAKGGISLEVCNDLQAAIEVNPGTGWRVMYPEERFCLDTFQPIDVATRLRDDPDICGTCRVDATALLRAKEAFGHFGPEAVEFVEAEQRQVEHERQLREARLQELKVALLASRTKGRCCVKGNMVCYCVCDDFIFGPVLVRLSLGLGGSWHGSGFD